MARKFDNARFVVGSNGGHLQLAGANLPSIFGREPVAAAKLFRCLRPAVEFLGARPGSNKNRLANADQRTGHLANHQVCGLGSDLLVSCIAYSQNIPGIL